MHKSPHWSIRTARILQRSFPDKEMLLHTPINPFYEIINHSLANESDRVKQELANTAKYSMNAQTCDFNEPYYIYKLDLEETPDQPINMSGTVGIDTVAIEVCDDMEEFYSRRITRVEYDTGISLSMANTGIGIVYAHDTGDRYGNYYVLTDTNPGDTGAMYVYDYEYSLEEATDVTKLDNFIDSYYWLDADEITMDTGATGKYIGGTYTIPYNICDTGSFNLYDMAHLNHYGTPIEISNTEYTLSGNQITLGPSVSGRSTYNANYYDSPMETGQPDQYWEGKYAANFYHTPFTGVNNGICTTSYFHNIPSLEGGYVYPNTPKAVDVVLPHEEAATENTNDYLYRIAPKFVRPGVGVNVNAVFTKKIEDTWDGVSTYTYTITDSDFSETNAEAIQVYAEGTKVTCSATVTDNIVTITPLETALSGLFTGSSFDVVIYYLVDIDQTVTAIGSYTFTTTNYSADFAINEYGKMIPYSMVPVNITGITESYANPTVTLTTEYDLKGLTYDPYRRVLWSIENNNKYLTARNVDNLGIIINFPLFRSDNERTVDFGGSKYQLVDYTATYSYDFRSIKWYAGYLYLLSSSGYLYTIDYLKDIPKLDIQYDTNGDLVYPELELSYSANPVDFTIDREANIVVLNSDNTIDVYNTYNDYAILDILRDTLYFREKYDDIDVFSNAPEGENRITYLDKTALTYFNLKRYTGETLHEFYDRLMKAYSHLYSNSFGINSTKQGVYNAIATHFDQDVYKIEQQRFFYLQKDPIEKNPYTGDSTSIRVYIDGTELTRMGRHPDDPYDTGLSIYAFNNTYKYSSIYDDPADTGFICWRDYDGDLTNIIEIYYPESYSEVEVTYSFLNDADNDVQAYDEKFDIDYPKSSGSVNYSVIPINESFLYDSGVMSYDALDEIEYMYSDIDRQWGYFTLDETPMATMDLQHRQNIMCYNIIDTGVLTGGL